MNAKFFFRCTILFSSFVSFGQVDSTDYNNRPIQEIEEVRVSSNFKEIAFEDSKNFIIDFEVSELGHYLLLKHMRKYQLVKLDEQLNVISKMTLNFKPTQLLSDCLGGLHVLSKDSMFQLNPFSEDLSIFERNSIDLYHDFYKSCVGQSGDYVYMEEINDFGQSKIFYAYDRKNGDQHLIYKIKDTVAAKDANLEYRGIMGDSYLENQVMLEINLAQLGASRDHFERISFFTFVLSKVDYNPLFVKGDTTYIFDHVNGYALHLSPSGDLLAKQAIHYHKAINWDEKNHLDPVRNVFYTEYEVNEGQQLAELTPNNFDLGRETKLDRDLHLKKLVVYDGYAYYTQRENYDANLNKLYRYRL